MKIYQIGPDEPYGLESETDFEWIVHDYSIGDYAGSGEAVGLCKTDGLLYIKNLGHCSCYGPMDGGLKSEGKMTIEEYLAHKDNILDYEAPDAMKKKVKQLTRRSEPRKRRVRL